ncbi:hypothetical protein WISP_136009 [Willisornis vidua]|uniref:Uncharacterized protein n=1 Tax=Willisornis vidua TaxID=1566151 RepID=A0ABQ9CUE1_9PASS|nr:hypothetical protein WISP_136009 [Willisornis vidua]
MFGFLDSKCTLPAHVQPVTHQQPQVLLGLFITQPVLILGVAPTQVQNLSLDLVKYHEIPMDPLLELVQVTLEGIPSFRYVNSTTQLGGICKLAEGGLNPFVYVIIEDTK